jgi:hypothetical protein
MPVILALWRLRQHDLDFEASKSLFQRKQKPQQQGWPWPQPCYYHSQCLTQAAQELGHIAICSPLG